MADSELVDGPVVDGPVVDGPVVDGPVVDGPAVLDWFRLQGRDLPWRATRDPWTILVSELMLQQTQASRVIDRLPRFLERFPSPALLASRPLAEVIDEWSGLGYNRRAVALHRAATVMASEHNGEVPNALEDLLGLPGVGPYTARAVRVFAFEHDDAVVDTNIGRVLSRISNARLKPSQAQSLADSLVPTGLGWEWNQAVMEVGALLCRPKPTSCGQCPFRSACAWHQLRHPDPDPATGSASVSGRQSKFVGSDRQGRGRLVLALRTSSLNTAELAGAAGWSNEAERALRVAEGLVSDGLVERIGDRWSLPNGASDG